MILTIRGPFSFESAEDLADDVDSWLRQELAASYCHRGTTPGKFWGELTCVVLPTPADLKRLARSLGKGNWTAELSECA